MTTGTYSRRKILVVDDDPSMLVFVKRQLENAGYAVLLAEDGIVGGHLALDGSPDLILVDVHMPYLSGYELVEALQSDSATWHIPVVFLTCDKHVEEQPRMLRGEACLKKPVQVDQLLEVVSLFTSGDV